MPSFSPLKDLMFWRSLGCGSSAVRTDICKPHREGALLVVIAAALMWCRREWSFTVVRSVTGLMLLSCKNFRHLLYLHFVFPDGNRAACVTDGTHTKTDVMSWCQKQTCLKNNRAYTQDKSTSEDEYSLKAGGRKWTFTPKLEKPSFWHGFCGSEGGPGEGRSPEDKAASWSCCVLRTAAVGWLSFPILFFWKMCVCVCVQRDVQILRSFVWCQACTGDRQKDRRWISGFQASMPKLMTVDHFRPL